jgi:DNA modification methylase
MGAGTVGLVAEQHGRDWIGIELSAEYRDLALQRIEKARGKP